jgi:hypothetical protein
VVEHPLCKRRRCDLQVSGRSWVQSPVEAKRFADFVKISIDALMVPRKRAMGAHLLL